MSYHIQYSVVSSLQLSSLQFFYLRFCWYLLAFRWWRCCSGSFFDSWLGET